MKKIIITTSFILIVNVILFAKNEGIKTDNNAHIKKSDIDIRIQKNFRYMDELIKSMNETIKKIEKRTAEIRDMEENKEKYLNCFMLDSLKADLDDLESKLKETPSEKRKRELSKIKAIYNREKIGKNCKGH